MLPARYHRLVSLGCSTGVVASLSLLGIDILLSSAVAIAVGVSIALLFLLNREFPERWTGQSWQDSRWTAVSLIVTNFAALVGIQLLPLSNGNTAAVSFLIIFVGLAAHLSGSLAEMERDRSNNEQTAEDKTVLSND